MRHTVRIALLATFAALEVAAAVASIATFTGPVGTYGFIVKADGATVAAVQRDSVAALAGIAPGDTIDYATLPTRGRRFIIFQEEVPQGAPITFAVERAGRSRVVTLRAQSIGVGSQIEELGYAIAGLALGLVGLVLVLLRPSLMTWSFALIAPPLLIPYALQFWAQQTQGIGPAAVDVLFAVLYAAQVGGMMCFAGRFPNDRPAGIARVVDRSSVPAGIAVATLYVYAYLQIRFGATAPAHWSPLADAAVVVPSVAGLLALMATYIATPGPTRSRILPVAGSFVLLIALSALVQIIAETTTNLTVVLAFGIAFALSPALVAAAVANGVIRHRVMDVSFLVSRTLVYTSLTVLAVAVFSLIEYVVGKLLEHERVAVLLEIGAAIALGVWLNAVHRRLDDLVDRVLFRKRHEAERRLAAAARALPHATTAAAVDASLVDEPAQAFGLASAALFRYEEDAYSRVHARGWDASDVVTLAPDDRLVMQLRADLAAIAPRDVSWQRAGLPDASRTVEYAVPVVIDHQVVAFTLYGGHETGEELDPDERRSLREIAFAAATAYDRVEAARTRRQLDSLESENDRLRTIERTLVDILSRRPT